jgi:hypothetical protein
MRKSNELFLIPQYSNLINFKKFNFMKKNEKSPTSNLPIQVKDIIKGIDCFKFYVDATSPRLNIDALQKHCTKLVVQAKLFEFNPIWCSEIRVFQPDSTFFHLIYKNIRDGGYRVKFAYIEVAIDFITNTTSEAKAIKNSLLAHIHVPTIKSKVRFSGISKTYYFSPRSLRGKKSQINFAIYHDKISKLNNSESSKCCCHAEVRLTGSNAISLFGITSIKDCLHFDHENFWAKKVQFVKLKSKVSLARKLNTSADISGTALRNRANIMLGDCNIGGVFVMQALVCKYPQVKNLLQPVGLVDLIKIDDQCQ